MSVDKSRGSGARKKNSTSRSAVKGKPALKKGAIEAEHRQKTIRQITGIAIIAAGFLLAICLMMPSSSGNIGGYISQYLRLLCGEVAWVVSPVLVYYGLALLLELPSIMLSRRQSLIGVFLMIFTLAAIMHLHFSKAQMWSEALKGNGGGLAGAIYAFAASFLFGKAAIPVFIICTFLIAFVLLGGNSLNKKLVLIVSKLSSNSSKGGIAKKTTDKKMEGKKIKQAVLNVEKQLHDKIADEPQKHQVFDMNEIRELGKHEKHQQTKNLFGISKKSVDDVVAETNALPEAPPEEVFYAIPQAAEKAQIVVEDNSESDNLSTTISDGSGVSNKVDDSYLSPNLALLNSAEKKVIHKNANDSQIRLIEDTLTSFGVQAKVIYVADGPSVTRYELQIGPGIKVSKILGLSDDLALSLASADIRIEAPIPGKSAIGIEVPKKKVQAVLIREVIESSIFTESLSPLTIALGKDVAGDAIVADLSAMPHLLVAGSTGSGKSVCINSMICSILYKANPAQVKLLMIDPKMVELNIYNGIPHLMAPVVTEAKKASGALKWVVREMENRYKLFAGAGSRDLRGYNELQRVAGEQQLPQIVVIIDELADLMMVSAADVEDSICRLAQMARAAGIHLVVATQRPSVDVITGLIKANIPSRISFAVSSQIDSRTILDMAGAEKLLGKGDMLFFPVGASKPQRVQGVFISEHEIEKVVQFVKQQPVIERESIDFVASIAAEQATKLDDDLFNEAGKLVIHAGQASVSLIQRRLRVGYARAARLIDMLEQEGVIGPYEGSKPREVLQDIEAFTERYE